MKAAVVAGSVNTTQLANDAVTYAKLQNVSATDRLLGRVSAGAGDVEELVCTAAGRALLDDVDNAAQRTTLALGTMAQQDAGAVAITGGSLEGLSLLSATTIATGTPIPFTSVSVFFDKPGGFNGLAFRHLGGNTGTGMPVNFQDSAGTNIGSITTTASATSYNTSSDVRLKHAITALTGALDVVRRLRPITHLWNTDNSRGYGFLAHELQREIPDAVTGEPDAVNEDGSVKPQQVDHSRLVPWLTAALQEAVAQVQTLSARVASLEEQLGV